MSHSSLWQATLESLRSFACACQRLGLESSLIWAKPKIGLPTLFMAMLIRCFMLVITTQFYWRWRRRGITDVSHLLQLFQQKSEWFANPFAGVANTDSWGSPNLRRLYFDTTIFDP